MGFCNKKQDHNAYLMMAMLMVRETVRHTVYCITYKCNMFKDLYSIRGVFRQTFPCKAAILV